MVAVPSLLLPDKLSFDLVAASYLFFLAGNAEGNLDLLLCYRCTLNYEMFFYIVVIRSLRRRQDIYWFIGVVLGLCALGSPAPNIESDALAFYFSSIGIEFIAGMLLAQLLVPGGFPAGRALRRSRRGSRCFLPCPAGRFRGFIGAGTPALLGVSGGVFGERWHAGRIPTFLLGPGAAPYSLHPFRPLVAQVASTVLIRVDVQSNCISK